MNTPLKRQLLKLPILALASLTVFGSAAWADDGPAHQVTSTRPIPLGVSGGNIHDIATFCCSGTLGALVQDSTGKQYILSNNHVLARSNQGSVGDQISQPGLVDSGCVFNPDTVANLTAWHLSFTNSTGNVDAAIAEVVSGKVDPSGTILDIGTISSTTVAPALGMAVKKSGRTTGLTHGQIASIDVSTSVKYLQKCAPGGKSDTASFQGQIRITPGEFSDSGDSGSLIVEDVANSPRAVGLLFAGSSSSTVANPIDTVLSRLSGVISTPLSMVGGAPTPTGTISGTVTSSSGGGPIADATVAAGSGQQATTDGAGSYTIFDVPAGSVDVTATAAGFQDSPPQNVNVLANQNSNADFVLDPSPSGSISGTVTNSVGGDAIAGATVESDTGESTQTAADGSYTLAGVPTGLRTVTASASGFESNSAQAQVDSGQTTSGINIQLTPITSATSAVVHCITYRTVAGPNQDKHLEIEIAIRDDLGNPVSGASVTALVTRPGGSTTFAGSTGSTGAVLFKFINAQSGTYSTDVTSVLAPALSFDGVEPINSFDKTSGPQTESFGACANPASSSRKPSPAQVSAVIQVKRRHEVEILARRNVVGMGVGLADGQPVIEIYLAEAPGANSGQDLPTQLENVPVRLIVTGGFVSRMSCTEQK